MDPSPQTIPHTSTNSASIPHAAAASAPSAVIAAMDAALAAARTGVRGANPLVGAAVIAPDGTVITGHHAGAGTPHAEPTAIRAAQAAGIDLTASILCVTLEPCSHHGRTPPCTDLILETGIPEVVLASADPNPAAAGGAARLRAAGVRVTTGVREEEALALNARWLRAVGERRPFVTLKIAQSLDGRIAAADGTSQWITSPTSRARVHDLRARVDAVVVGTGTALADDPRLTARPTAEAGQSSRTRPASEAATPPLTQPTPVVIGMRDLDPGSHLAQDPRTIHLRMHDPLEALTDLKDRGIDHVLVEGGATLAGALVRADLVDELELHIAPVLLGDGLLGLADLGITTLTEAIRWQPDPVEPLATAPPESSPPESAPANPDTILRLIPHSSHPNRTSHPKGS
jgi:diaminohydroxyphosphoribosylaminopyrimidine deaminase/5-amino-6-(5-phosphoribosylamino)uracil reductase